MRGRPTTKYQCVSRPDECNANHSRAPELDALVHERSDWHAFRPKDAVTRLGEVTP